MNPLLLLLLASVFILMMGTVVLLAARRWPRAVSYLLVVIVGAGFCAMGYAASPLCGEADTGRWLVGGLVLVILGCPAYVLVPAEAAPSISVAHPGAAQQGIALLLGYLFACWFMVLGISILVFLFASPPGSFR
jgi:hypothetical protein